MAKKQPKSKTAKRQASDPLVNHVKRAVKTAKRVGKAVSNLVPGVAAKRLITRARKAMEKVNRVK